jgi:hypothetical protein
MAVERDILISILKLTKSGPIAKEIVARDSNVSAQVTEEVLKKFRDAELVKLKDRTIEASSNQRAKIAIHAIKSGADFERVCRVLEWQQRHSKPTTSLLEGASGLDGLKGGGKSTFLAVENLSSPAWIASIGVMVGEGRR